MKSSTQFLLVTSLLGTLGLGSLAKANSLNPSPAPIAVISTHQVKIANKTDADREVKDARVPAPLAEVGESGEDIYDMAKINNWQKAAASLTTLQTSTKRLQTENKALDVSKLNATLQQLNTSIKAKNRADTMRYANQITLHAAQLTAEYQLKVPIEVTLLDYYGRELEIWSTAGNTGQLKTIANQMSQTWKTVRPEIISHGGVKQAKTFDILVLQVEKAKSVSEYGRLATPILDEVDNLETVFK